MTPRRHFIVGAICLALNHKTNALTNASCQVCKRWFIYSCQGYGYARDLNVTCGRCSFRDKFNDRFAPEDELVDLIMNMAARVREAWDQGNNLGEKITNVSDLLGTFYSRIDESSLRYITFDDGTVLDINHVFAAALLGSRGYGENVSLDEYYDAQWDAMALGELNEIQQWLAGSDSGHPLGGNEDVYSNWVGARMGAKGIIQHGHGDLGTQLSDYFESLGHGAISNHQRQQPVGGLEGCG